MSERDKVLRANLILWEGKLGVDIVFASGYRVALPMTEETVSVEALLAAERERCAKVAASFEVGPWWRETDIPPAIAAAIRSLAPQTADATPQCEHVETIADWDHSTCRACGMVRTGSAGWTIAKRRWFRDIDEARFYEKHGRLPAPPASGDRSP